MINNPLSPTKGFLLLSFLTKALVAVVFFLFFRLIFLVDSSATNQKVNLLIALAIFCVFSTVLDTYQQRTKMLLYYNLQYKPIYITYPQLPSYYFNKDLLNYTLVSATSNIIAIIFAGTACFFLNPLVPITYILITGLLAVLITVCLFLISFFLGIYFSHAAASVLAAFLLSGLTANSFANTSYSLGLEEVELFTLGGLGITYVIAAPVLYFLAAGKLNAQLTYTRKDV